MDPNAALLPPSPLGPVWTRTARTPYGRSGDRGTFTTVSAWTHLDPNGLETYGQSRHVCRHRLLDPCGTHAFYPDGRVWRGGGGGGGRRGEGGEVTALLVPLPLGPYGLWPRDKCTMGRLTKVRRGNIALSSFIRQDIACLVTTVARTEEHRP